MRILLSFAGMFMASSAFAAPVINEIFYRPPGAVEPVGQEWIEIYNPDVAAVDVSGWALTKGVSFTIPAATTIPAGGYLVIAANVADFNAAHPGFAGTVIGGWTGQLANGGEQIQINDALGNKVNDVRYADEGDWSLRARQVVTQGHAGLEWVSLADGGGRTLELRNPVVGNASGQNWGESAAAGGTPGAANSVASTNVAPLIKDAKHRPEIPTSTQAIVVSSDLEDEAGSVATLHWRLDGGAWATLPMSDTDADGDVEASIPAQANLAIVEWYISATDGTNTRTWPAPARTSGPGVLPETFGQVANALVLVDDSFNASATFLTPADSPVYRIIMTDADRDELVQIGTTDGEQESQATFNATFISHDGTGVRSIHNCGTRNRGGGDTALGPPNNYSVSFRSDDSWNGRGGITINAYYPQSQALGNAMFTRAGALTQEAAIIRVRLNGVDMAETGGRMLGRYVLLEGRNSEWAARHFPADSEGNFYRVDDHYPGVDGTPAENLAIGEFRYEGTNHANYAESYFKETNKEEADFSDMVNFTRIISAPATGGTAGQPAISDAAYPAAVATVLDVDAFYRFIATDALIGNQEGGLQSGRADDVSMYRGVADPRFRFVAHDMDDVFGIGAGAGDGSTRSIFSYDEQVQQGNTGVVGLRRMFNHPALLPRYYAALMEGLDTWFNHATIDPIIDQIMQGWVPAGTITNVKAFIDTRRANVLAQIQQNYALTVTTAGTAIEGIARTTNGAATLSGTFNVARTYSITVNGVLATWSYRNTGTAAGDDDAGEWFLTVPSGGGGVLSPGLNTIVVRFWGGLGGTGAIVHEIARQVIWEPTTPVYTNVSGTLAPSGSIAITVPADYIPGIPFLVRVDVRDGAGNLDRTAWNRTATLTATNGVTLTPSTVDIKNGMGSALVTVGGGGTTVVPIFTYGTGGTGTTAANSGTVGSTWKYRGDFTPATLAAFVTANGTTWKNEGFDDSTWPSIVTQTGYGDADENRAFTRVDYDTLATDTQSGPSYLFRNTFTIADVAQLVSVTGQIKFDDAAAVYVNGTEILRTATLPAATPLTSYANATPTQENATSAITVPLGLLHNGVNTIAVEIHQADPGSSDVTFDLRLSATVTTGAADPGNFTLTAAVGSLNSSKAIASLTPTPTMTNVSGSLPAGTTTWSGVMNVTGDVTVPAGSTLNIAAGTHILMAGDATVGSTAGADLIVATGGTVNAIGTASLPISITANAAANRWGEINVNGSTTNWQYCLVSRAAHSPGGGHTGTGPAFRLSNGAVWTFEDGAITDLPGKTLTNTGNTTMTMRRSHFARCVMGPETDGSGITIEDCNFSEMLAVYRESGAPDDEDNIYIHDSGGRPVNLRRSVFANCGDDAIDLLGGTITVEDCIVRDAFDKGISLLNNNITVRRTQIIDCDICVSTKCQVGATETTPFLNTFENCTIVAENHPTNTSDGTFHSVGVHTRNKYGTTTMNITVDLKNCIISAEQPVANDYGAGTFPLNVQNYTCFHDQGGTNPNDPLPTSGTGNIALDPLFANFATNDFHLQAASPARNTGDPASPLDSDGSRADMGALPYGTSGPATGSLVWTPAGGPYRVTANTTVPSGLTLTVMPGTSVYFDGGARLTVNGQMLALGSSDKRITFSHVPGTVAAGDADPIKLLTQTGPAKWGGIRVVDAMASESQFKYCDFINAQGTSPSGSENYGSLGFIRSWGYAEGCTFAGTHLRMLYGRNSKLTFIKNIMPDMFIFDPLLGRIEEPTTDFIAAADNSMEPMKVEFPTSDPEVSGANAANFPNGLPLNGHWRVYYNSFHGNRGHQDVFDCDSGRWAPRDPVTNFQSNGQFVIDCRYNHFFGLAGDEHMDLGGDAYIASNIFENATKDFWTNDTGYSNAISSGDKGTGTTIMVVRNICYDMDHVINLKANTATIFEHNTVANFHADFQFVGSTVTQNVICAPINFYVPGDGGAPTRGDGAYVGFNIISNVPHVFSSPDISSSGPVDTKIEFFHNLLDQIGDPEVGARHPGGFFSGTYGPNTAGAPGFVNPAAEDYSLSATSLARRSTINGFDFGASIPEWAYVIGGPVGTTDQTSASFTVGGPGIVAYKWRIDGGAWSVPVQIGDGGLFSRTNLCVRQATLTLNSLTPGIHTLEVLGQDMAGNWQDNDPARTIIGAAQAGPTVRTWTVDVSNPTVRVSEVLANSATLADSVELHNFGTSPVTLTGWALTDDLLVPAKFPLPVTTIPAGGYATFSSALLNLDKDGDAVYLFEGATQRDGVVFGPQVGDMTIGRVVFDNALVWKLGTPSFGAANNRVITADQSGIRISEWFSNGSALYSSDWIELSNSQAFPVELSGLRITDNRVGSPTQFTMPPLSYIGATGFLKIVAGGSGGTGLPFSLSDLQDDITLFDSTGALLDAVQFFQQTTDYSQGRNGTGLTQYELPTAGLSNTTTDANALALLRGLRISEVMFNALGGQDFEYVELTNVGATGLQLQNVKFVQGITFTFTAPTTLNAGESIVVVKNLTKFRSRYGNSPSVAGTYTGNLDNSGETLAIQLPPPFDANILTFAYGDSWRLSADGGGTALTTLPGITKASLWGDKDTWTATTLGGSPMGFAPRTDTFSGWMTLNGVNAIGDDADQDGVLALVECALGMNPNNPSGGHGAAGVPAVGGAGTTYTFLVPENAAAAQGHGVADLIYTVQGRSDLVSGTWGTVATKSFGTNWTGTVTVGAPSGGFVPVTVTDTTGGPQRFFRLQITWAP